MHDPIPAARGSATALRFVADPRYLPNTTKRRTDPRTSKICHPCPPTFLLPISPAGHSLNHRNRCPCCNDSGQPKTCSLVENLKLLDRALTAPCHDEHLQIKERRKS